jgi:acyl carrier protein|tara:strand:+ start:395 stop:1639 length:1245 start_codon:yes stop_codon:yes gene_type:complete
MFTTQNRYTIRVSNPNVIKRFNEDGRKYYEMDARVNFNDLVADLPNDPNIRSNEILGRQLSRKKGTPVTVKATAKQEEGTAGLFAVKNKGITVIAKDIKKFNETTYEAHIPSGYGIADGIKTYSIIQEVIKEEDRIIDESVKMNFIVGDFTDDEILEISTGLNSGDEVEQWSIFDQQGIFDPIKKALKGHAAENWIRYNETDPKKHEHAVLDSFANVRHVVSLLKLFDITSPPRATKHQQPTEAYTNMAGHVEEFASKPELGEIYSSLVPQMLEMEEYIRVRGGALWNDFVKATAKPKDKEFKANSFTSKPKDKFNNKTYPLTGLEVGYQDVLSKALTVPILAAFRDFVKVEDKQAKWTISIDDFKKLFESCSDEILDDMRGQGENCEWNSNNMGKSEQLYKALHRTIQLHTRK